ncbi:MAG TPA: LysR family transcriptional regulator [Burkholderiales bacterium]|jgi:DNA-binding transcriptional LysR family regulator|nr:LysR family transcriptional regulator [Burkholderiales bacterium]
MELRQLDALRTIARMGSFTLAARQLNVTQSALSHQIRKLELELGETLVVRSKPKVRLSAAGERVAATAEQILTQVDRLKRQFAPGEVEDLEGSLRVAVSALGLEYLYGHLYEAFILAYPRIELIVTATETPADGVKQVIARSADVAFAPFPLESASSALETVTLGRMEHVFVVAPKHPMAQGHAVPVDQVKASPFIRYVAGAGARRASDQFFQRCGGYPPILMESNDTGFIKRIVSMGLGLALMPYVTVRHELARAELRVVRVGGAALIQDFGLVHRRATRMRALELFKRLCIERRASIPGIVDPGTVTARARSTQ